MNLLAKQRDAEQSAAMEAGDGFFSVDDGRR